MTTRDATAGEQIPQFADGKAPDALRTIGEVARALGIRQHVLRYWEEQFPMLRPVKRSGGRRYYRLEDVRMVAMIDRLVHREGFTLRGARQALSRQATGEKEALPLVAPAESVPLSYDARTCLLAIRARLETALKAA